MSVRRRRSSRLAGNPAVAGEAPGSPANARLSARQRQILQQLSLGRSNKEIAHELGLTDGTVKQHVHALFRKLGVSNRTMAVVRGARPADAGNNEVSQRVPAGLSYARRLVTAVVLEPRPTPVISTKDAVLLEQGIRRLRAMFERLAADFDAAFESLPGGGMTAWFGDRVAHGDDVVRAVAFVRSLLAEHVGTGPVPYTLGLGTVPEVVGEEGRSSLAFRAFRVGTVLASLARPGAPLACETTARMAGLAELEAGTEPAANARVIHAEEKPSTQAADAWGGLPFLADVEAAVRGGHSQWIAIESWPPDAGTRLIHAMGECLVERGFPVLGIWMPAPNSPRSAAECIVGQVRAALFRRGHNLAGSLPDDALAELASQGTAVLLAYGIDALPALKASLKAATLERLRSAPLVIVGGAIPRSGAPQTVVRLLGDHPGEAPFARVLRMKVPEGNASALEGIRPDVQAVLDRVSPFARAIARAAANAGVDDLDSLALAVGAAKDVVIAGCHELRRAGLIVMDSGTLQFRDDATAGAVRATLVAHVA